MIKHEILTQTATDAKLRISIGKTELEPARKAVLDKLRAGVKAAGFRPGKAPDAIVERETGEARVQSEVIEAAIGQSYGQVIIESGLETISSPEVSLGKFVPYSELEYTAEVPLMPEVKFDYTKLRVSEPEPTVDDKEVEETLEGLRRQAATRAESKVGIKDGDEVKMDFEGWREGKPVEGAVAQNQTITIGEGRFIPGFEDALLGVKAGEGKEFEVTFPKDYHAKDLAGAKVKFKATVHEVSQVTLPVLDDAFASHVGPFKTLDDLRKDLRARMVEQRQEEMSRSYGDAVVDAAIKAAQLELPQSLVEAQRQQLSRDVEQQLEQAQMKLDDYLKMQGKARADYDAELLDEAKKRVTMALLVRYVIQQEKISVSDNELDDAISSMRERYTDPEMISHMEHGHFRDDVRQQLLSDKAADVLRKYAKGDGESGKIKAETKTKLSKPKQADKKAKK